MNPGTIVLAPLLRVGAPVMPVRHLGDMTETNALIAERERAQALDYLIGRDASARATQVQREALDATQQQAQRSQETTQKILDAGVQAQSQTAASVSKLGKTVVIGFLAITIVAKIVALFAKPSKEDAA